jgi:hypothetical protein
MKPLKGDQQLRSVSLSYSVALQALKPKPSPRRRRGLDASTDRGLTERRGEAFLLDILSHRMSDIEILRQLPVRSVVQCDSFPRCPRTFENARVRYWRFDAVACQTVAAQYILTILSISN